MDTLLNDIRYGARMLWKNKGLSAIALLSLAVGIGGNAAVFSVVNSVLFRPRAVLRPHELVAIYNGDHQQPYQSMSYPTYQELRDKSGVFSGLAAYAIARQFTITGSEDVEQIWGEVVAGNYFDVLGVRPALGRLLNPSDDVTPGAHPVVVLSHAFWRTRLAGRADVVGRDVLLNGYRFTVVGVTPEGFNGSQLGVSRSLYVPMMMQAVMRPPRAGYSGEMDPDLLKKRDGRWLTGLGRLKDGVTPEQATESLTPLAASLVTRRPPPGT